MPEPEPLVMRPEPGTISLRAWLVAAAVMILIVTAQLVTVTRGPNIHQDETTILDLGRTFLHPHTDWSVDIMVSGQPVALVNYLGSLIQELARSVTSPSPVGPRVTSMAGAVLAAALLANWLALLGASASAAMGLGFLFFLDPVFFGSYREARPDCWAIALGLAACCILDTLATDCRPAGKSTRSLLLAGALLVVALFIWPTAVLLVPLVLWRAAACSRRIGKPGNTLRNLLPVAARMALGGLLIAIPILIPVWGLIRDTSSLDALLHNNLAARTTFSIAHVLSNVRNLVQISKLSPVVLVGLLAGLVTPRSRTLMALTSLLLGVLLVTWVYEMRIVYLLPYLLCLTARLEETRIGSFYRRALKPAVISGLVAWAAFVTLGVFTASVLHWKTGKDPAVLSESALDHIGSGPHAVFLDTSALAFYYVGRELGWHMYRPLEEGEGAVPYFEVAAGLLSKVDFAIVTRDTAPAMKDLLIRKGLGYEVTLLDFAIDRRYPYRLALGHAPYGPYLLYTRRSGRPSR